MNETVIKILKISEDVFRKSNYLCLIVFLASIITWVMMQVYNVVREMWLIKKRIPPIEIRIVNG